MMSRSYLDDDHHIPTEPEPSWAEDREFRENDGENAACSAQHNSNISNGNISCMQNSISF